jgi:hypothetical protein
VGLKIPVTFPVRISFVAWTMSKLLRGLVAGYGARKLGGGCFSTVLVFLLLWWLLGYCNAMQ